MNHCQKIFGAIITIFLISNISSCKKIDNFLDKKSNINDVRPTTLADFQSVLDNTNVMNNNYVGIGLIASDNIYFTNDKFNILSQTEQNAYLWAVDNLYEGDGGISYDWNYAYQKIGYANIVLDGLKNVERSTTNASNYDNIKGEAKFFRAYAYYSLSQVYCKPFSTETAKSDLGLVLKQSSDVNEKVTRSSVLGSYNQIISDLEDAVNLLPTSSQYQTRPTKPAANAALAKVFLSMQEYDSALAYANKTLDEFNQLLDFNDGSLINPSSTYRFPAFPKNPEVIWWANSIAYMATYNYTRSRANIDSTLYNSYDNNDLRKSLYYFDNGNGNIQIRGCFSGNGYGFAGIANDEVLLIKAECEARKNDVTNAMADLNSLLVKRYKKGTYQNISASNAEEALRTILAERRKELAFTGELRWEDLRRLSTDSRFAITLKRIINGKTYTLPPNDPKYVFPLPDMEIKQNGLQQN